MRQQTSAVKAPGWCVAEATDADEHAHNLRDWEQQYDQLSDGAFYGRIDEVALPRLQVFREFTSQALRQQCNVWPDSVWLGFSSDDNGCRINGQQVSADQLMCRPGNCEFELLTPQNFGIYGIVISHQALLNTAAAQKIRIDAGMWSQPRRQWNTQKLNMLRYVLQRLLAPQHSGQGAALQEDMLLTSVLDILQQETPLVAERPALQRRQQVVDRVRQYLQEHQHEPVTVTELCRIAHVSRRTLQYSFETVLGISPLRYLRVSRLNNVRRTLLHGLEDGETIAARAASWGFWHPGQFAHDYKQLFGENPSQTLQRNESGMKAE